MKVLPVRGCSDDIADRKLMLLKQQELVAKLFRSGQKERARMARSKLYLMLNELDLLEEGTRPNRSASASEQTSVSEQTAAA